MARCNGYRPRNAVRAEVEALRAQLRTLRGAQWQRAQMIMDRITALMGHHGGPSRGSIAPRTCAHCGYFGHTKQHCAARARKEEAEADREIREHARERERKRARVAACVDPEWHAAWSARLAWLDARYEASVLAGHVRCEAPDPCGACARCEGYARFCAVYEPRAPAMPERAPRRLTASSCPG